MQHQDKKRLGAIRLASILLFLLAIVIPVSAEGEAVEVIVTPQNPEVQVGESIVITAEGRDKDGNVVPVSDPHWEADGQCGTITPDPNDPSKATYTATAEGSDCYALCYQGLPSSGGAYHSTDIRVVPIKLVSPQLARVDVAPNDVKLTVGDSQLFTATGHDQNGNAYQITPIWSTDGGTVDQNGNYTATVPGDFTVTASVQGSNVEGKAKLSIDADSSQLAGVSVTPNDVKLTVGESQLFTATGHDQNGNTYQITPIWSTNGGTVDQNGTYTATVPGDFTVTASVQGSGAKGEAKLSVVDESSVYLEKIEVAPPSVSMLAGQQQLFSATGYDQNGNTYQITPIWSTNGGTVDQNGTYTATIPGDFIVTASVQGSGAKGQATVSVDDPSSVYLEKIEVAPPSVSMLVGQQQLFSATGYDQNGQPISLEPVWSASGGTVDQTGTYTANEKGTFAVTAASQDGAVAGSAEVNVEAEAKPSAGWYIGGAAVLALAAGGFLLQNKKKVG